MRNFNTETEELRKAIEQLEIQKSEKEAQLEQVVKEQRESKTYKKEKVFKDRNDTVISIGDWVKTITPGRFKLNEGRVIGFKSWVTFEEEGGVKQTRASKNLVVCNHVRKRHARCRGAGANKCCSTEFRTDANTR